MSDAASNPTEGLYQHIHPDALAQATREQLARLELEDHQIRMQAVISGNPDAALANGETITVALERIAESKARLQETYDYLLTRQVEEITEETT